MTDKKPMTLNQPSAVPEQSINGEEKRRWPRFQLGIKYICVIIGEEPKIAAVVDDSIGGIGLMMEMKDAEGIQPGDEVIILSYGVPTWGSVEWIKKDQQTGQLRLGIHLSEKDAYVT
jgi:hypothetical protein